MKKLALAILGMTMVSCAHERRWSDRANPVPGPKTEAAREVTFTPSSEISAGKAEADKLPETQNQKECINPDGTPCVETIVMGGLDKSVIDEYIRRHLLQLRSCYEQVLPIKPTLRGRVLTKFVIHGSGKVESARVMETTLGKPEVERCVLGVLRRIEFPEPLGGGRVEVDYPFSFAPAASASSNTPLGPIACAEPYYELFKRFGRHDGSQDCGKVNQKTGQVDVVDFEAVRWGRTWVFFRDNAAYGWVDHGKYQSCSEAWITNVCGK